MPDLKRQLKNTSKLALRKLFEKIQLLGFDLLPRHFYSEIPDIGELKRNESWRAPYSMVGVDGTSSDEQHDFIKSCCSQSIIEKVRARDIHALASKKNGEEGFGPTEADFLFAFVATKRPEQIFQIGCGVSTAVCLIAAEHVGYTPEIICVEPYPTDFLIRSAKEDKVNLIKRKVEKLDLATIENLRHDVFFFVDSTHTLGPAGEVSRVVLEMLPRLKKGARVHFHDIKFPYDYGRHILDSALFFQHESVLLHAFLAHNERFRVLASLSMMHYSDPKLLQEYLPNYRPAANVDGLNKSDGHFPSSTYLEVVGSP